MQEVKYKYSFQVGYHWYCDLHMCMEKCHEKENLFHLLFEALVEKDWPKRFEPRSNLNFLSIFAFIYYILLTRFEKRITKEKTYC